MVYSGSEWEVSVFFIENSPTLCFNCCRNGVEAPPLLRSTYYGYDAGVRAIGHAGTGSPSMVGLRQGIKRATSPWPGNKKKIKVEETQLRAILVLSSLMCMLFNA